MKRETIFGKIDIREIKEVVVREHHSDDVDDYWVLQIGSITLFPDQDWLTHLASQIATVLPAKERSKILEAIRNVGKKEIAPRRIKIAPEEKINVHQTALSKV